MICTSWRQEREQRPCLRVDTPVHRVRVGEEPGGWNRRDLHRGRVVELHEEALFTGSESVARALSELDEKVETILLALTCVHRPAPLGVRLLIAFRAARVRAGGDLAVVAEEDLAAAFRVLNPDIAVFNTLDTAVAWVRIGCTPPTVGVPPRRVATEGLSVEPLLAAT